MKLLRSLMAREPAAVMAAVVALVGALAVPEAWSKVIVALVALAGGAVTRSQVYPADTVDGLTPPPE